MLFKGRDVFKCPSPRSGLTIHGDEFEWIEAAHIDNMSYLVFRKQSVEYQEKLIGYHRTKQQMAAVVAHANRPKKKR